MEQRSFASLSPDKIYNEKEEIVLKKWLNLMPIKTGNKKRPCRSRALILFTPITDSSYGRKAVYQYVFGGHFRV